MWLMLIISFLVVAIDKGGFLLDENIESIIYIKDDAISETKEELDLTKKDIEPEESASSFLDDSDDIASMADKILSDTASGK